jgi:hypothetical protein
MNVPTTNTHLGQMKHNSSESGWRERTDDGHGQPLRFPSCEWCGSMTPQHFLELLANPASSCDVADWKYGFPHKIYVTTPNPQPDELRKCGSTSQGSKLQYDTDGRVTHRLKTQDTAPEGFPEWCDSLGWHYRSTYPTLMLKFYTEHFADLPDLNDHTDLIWKHTGIKFERDSEGRLTYQRIPFASVAQ